MTEFLIEPGGTNPTRSPREHGISPPAEPRLPKRIGRYTIVRRIGRGGMGAVYEAVQDSPQRTVALKVMSSLLDTPSAPRRFAQESELLGRLDHPCIAKVFESGTAETPDGHVAYITMEFIAGAIPITEHAKIKRLETRERIALFIDICDALHHAHEQGIVHRDIKPTNILVDTFDRVKVIDFGVARSLYSEQAPTQMRTSAGELVGTLEYMSPEQCGGNPDDLDRRADVYGLGVVLYELLTGRLPYDLSRADIARAVAIILAAPPIQPSRFRKELKGDLETILLKALQKEPERRYQTAAELGGDLRRFLAGEPIVARRDSTLYVVNRRARSLAATRPIGSTLVLAVLFSTLLAICANQMIRLLPASQVKFSMLIDKFAPRHLPKEAGPRHIRVVRVNDSTDMSAIASREGLENVTADARFTWRAVYGRLLDRLAAAGAKGVVFDIAFPELPTTPDGADPAAEYDAEFARGMREFAASPDRGVPVVIAPDWRFEDGVATAVSPGLRDASRAGGGSGGGVSASQAYIDLAIFRKGKILPSLAACALGEFWHPQSRLGMVFSENKFYFNFTRFDEKRRTYVEVGEPKEVTITSLDKPSREKSEMFGFEPGDRLVQIYIDFPGAAYLLHDSKPIEDVMASGRDLSDWASGRIIVVANFQESAGDRHVTAAGDREFHGVEAQVAALDAILSGRFARDSSHLEQMLAIVTAVVCGVAAGWVSGGSKRVFAVLVVGLTAGWIFVTFVAYNRYGVLFSPLVHVCAVLLGAIVGWWVSSQRSFMRRDLASSRFL